MKLFEYSIAWRFSSENWEIGLVKAESKEKAEELVRESNPGIIHCSIYDTIEGIADNEIYSLYSH